MTAPSTQATALARYEPSPKVISVEWDRELRGANYLMKSGLCPTGIKSAEAALFVILAGRDLGLSPVAALRNISVIQGKIELAADMQLALFARAGGSFKWVTLSESEAALWLNAPWLAAPHVSKWSMEDARRAQLTNGDNWKKYPRAMLRSRAITAGLKDIGFDATAGVYAPGEISEGAVVDEETEVVLTPAAAEETGEAPSEEQMALYWKMLRSHVWTDEEREDWRLRAEGKKKRDMTALIDELIEESRKRKAAERAATKAAEGSDA
jgi:hypothetical protein